MLILNPALTEDAKCLEKLLQSLRTSFSQCSFFDDCAAVALGGGSSKDCLAPFIEALASGFLDAAKEVTTATGPPQPGSAAKAAPVANVGASDLRPGSYDAWVVLLRTVLEDNGVDIEAVFDNSGASTEVVRDESDGDGDVESDRWASLTPAEAWAEDEIETVLDLLISKKTLLELPDIPFHPGCKVFALLREDEQWHPAVVQREVAFADIWEDGYTPSTPPTAEAVQDQGDEDKEAAESELGEGAAKSGGKQKSVYKKMKPMDIFSAMVQNRFFEVHFSEFGKTRALRFDKLMLNETVEDDEGVEGMLCDEGECEICRRSIFLTFHHLIPKQTHNRWLRRKKLPEGVKGYESGSRKKLPSSAVQAKPSAKDKKAASGKAASKAKASASKGDNHCNRYFLNTYGIMVCRQCHSQIHHMASNMDLAKRYNTLERVLNAPLMHKCAFAA